MHITLNNDFEGANKLAQFMSFYERVYNNIVNLPIKFLRLVLKILLSILFITALPILYVVVILLFKKLSKKLSIINANLNELTISELSALKINFHDEKSAASIKDAKFQKPIPLVMRPLNSSLKELFSAGLALNESIDNQIKADLELFNEALKTDTLIGDNA